MAASIRLHNFSFFGRKLLENRLSLRDPLFLTRPYVSKSSKEYAEAQTAPANEMSNDGQEQFRVYEIVGLKQRDRVMKKKIKKRPVQPPRYLRMPVDQDWTKVWPTAASFKYSAIPFPVRQGFVAKVNENEGIIPGKYANAELMKIPNFLHLTPKHIEQHCEVLKKFCTPWPKNLNTDNIEEHFPLTVTTYTYCHSGPSLRHPKARVVKMQFKLQELNFDEHGKDKFIRLVGDRYDPKTDIVTIEADRCPVKVQNYDYIKYLITALYFESQKIEEWELLKEQSDWERYYWDKDSPSKKAILQLLREQKRISMESENPTGIVTEFAPDCDDEEIVELPVVQQYKNAIVEMLDKGEDSVTLSKYKDSVLALYGIRKV